MAPKGKNEKKESGRAKKAENEAKKKEKVEADKEAKEAAKWADSDSKGAKSASKKAEAEEKRKAELARKAENQRLLAEEEAGAARIVKNAPKAGGKKPGGSSAKAGANQSKPAGPGAIAAGGGLGASTGVDNGIGKNEEEGLVESFAATGLDNTLELLDVINAKTDKASVGQQAAGIERHPERRFKAAFEAFKERELPNVKNDFPGLRLNQYQEMLYKQFQKHPDNPFNQVTVAYDASKEEKVEALKSKKAKVEESMRDRS